MRFGAGGRDGADAPVVVVGMLPVVGIKVLPAVRSTLLPIVILLGLMPAVMSCRPAPAGDRLSMQPAESSTARIEAIDSLLLAEVAARNIAGAAIQIVHRGRILHRAAYGYAQLYDYGLVPLDPPDTLTTAHLFDLASLTKVFGTTFGIMRLVDQGLLDLDAPIRQYLPEFSGGDKDRITARHLLTHTSGLAQWEPIYYHASTREGVLDFISKEPLAFEVGASRHYSDLGFMMLGFLIERISKRPLDQFLHDEIYAPLGLRHTMYRPLDQGISPEMIAATSHGNPFEKRMVYDDNFGYVCDEDPESWDGWRTYTIRGEVSDGNSFYANEGIAGHAGLFSTLDDLQRLVDVLLDQGEPLLGPETVGAFLRKDSYGNGLGWAMDPDAILTVDAPEGTFGHTGFTGTNVVVVPSLDLSIILLTNRENVGQEESGYYYNLNSTRREIFAIALDRARHDRASH